MSIYKRYSNKSKCMYFMIKDENFFDKYMTIWEKVSNIKKIVNLYIVAHHHPPPHLHFGFKFLKFLKKGGGGASRGW